MCTKNYIGYIPCYESIYLFYQKSIKQFQIIKYFAISTDATWTRGHLFTCGTRDYCLANNVTAMRRWHARVITIRPLHQQTTHALSKGTGLAPNRWNCPFTNTPFFPKQWRKNLPLSYIIWRCFLEIYDDISTLTSTFPWELFLPIVTLSFLIQYSKSDPLSLAKILLLSSVSPWLRFSLGIVTCFGAISAPMPLLLGDVIFTRSNW